MMHNFSITRAKLFKNGCANKCDPRMQKKTLTVKNIGASVKRKKAPVEGGTKYILRYFMLFIKIIFTLQVDLDSTMRKSVSQCRPENFYLHGYGRSQGMVNHVTNLTDAVALLTQATEPLIHGKKLSGLVIV